MSAKRIEKYQGFWIKQEVESGCFFWENGPDGDGYFDNIGEARESIDDYNIELYGRDIREDTPSLPERHPY